MAILPFVCLVVALPAKALTHWEIPLIHQTSPESKNLDTPIAKLSVELEAETLVVHAQMPDRNAATLRGARTAPDGFSDSDTHLVIYIDPTGDGRFAQVFGLNIAGAIQDGVYRESTKAQDTGVDFIWTGTTAITETGWRADFRIPLKSLFLTGKSVTAPRIYAEYYRVGDNTEIFTTHDTSPDGGCLLCKAAVLSEFSAQAAEYPTWTLRPTAAFQSTQTSPAMAGAPSGSSLQYGLDFSVQASPSWTVAGTWHPNFADREPDQPAFTKDAQFSPWQGETRRFFEHGSDVFQVASIINTRQIANPSLAIQAIGRTELLTSRWLLAEDQGGGTVITPGVYSNGFALAPKSRNLIGRGILPTGDNDVGFALTDRDYGAGLGSNQVLALDAHQKFAGDSQFSGVLAYSQTSACANAGLLYECPRQTGQSINAQVTRNQDLLDVGFTVEDVSPRFRNDLGWQTQNGYRFVNAWWWPSVAKDLPLGLSRIDWQPQLAAKVDDSGNTIFQTLMLGSKLAFKSGPVLALTLTPLSRHRMSADQALVNARNLDASLTISPSTVWQKSMIDVTVGELSDYANLRASHGYSLSTDQVMALSRALSVHLNGSWTRSRAVDAVVSGPTIQEGVALLTANYQYESFSRVRWATQWHHYLGWDLAQLPASAYSGSNVTHSLAWIHEPRVGLGYSVSLSHQANQNNGTAQNISLITVKAGYSF